MSLTAPAVYRSSTTCAFDTNGIPPTASISTTATDVDLIATPGLQVLEGSTLPIQAVVNDDVQVQNVELLVNGQVVQNAVSFPFNFSVIAPTIATSGSSFTIQLLATDTGGNVGLSNVLTIGLVSDTSRITISNFAPANNSSTTEGLQSVQVTFSKAVAVGTVTAANFQLQSGGSTITPTVIELRNNGTLVELSYAFLLAGTYSLVINGAAVTDNVGHPLSTGNVTDSFTLTPRETLTVTNPDAAPSTPGFQLFEGVTVTGSVTVVTGVSIQEVDLLLNGQVVATGASAPLTYSFIAPLLSAGASSFTLQARVIDVNGVATVSSPLTVGLLRDLTPPTIVSTSPANGGTATQGLQTLTITFSKSLSASSSAAANFQLAKADSSGLFGSGHETLVTITTIQLLSDSTQVVLTTAGLASGTYQLRVIQSGITDRVGNALRQGTTIIQWTIPNFTIDHSAGFTSHSDLTANGNAKFTGTVARLTDGGGFEASSIFSDNAVNISQFNTTFTFQFQPGTSPVADGITFTIQGNSPTALGSYGGYPGYAGIGKSVAIKFDTYDNAGEGTDSTGLFTNGALPFVPAVNLSGSGITLQNQDVKQVVLDYNGTTLTEKITDTATKVSFTTSYQVNIPSFVGGSIAYIGFTGGTGSLTALQDIQTWTFTSGQPQFLAGTPKASTEDTPNLTEAQLQPVVTQSIADLASAGYNVSGLGQVQFHLTSLPNSLLGWTYQSTIWIDPTAQGYGWYTDSSPSSNAAFTQTISTNEVQAAPGSPAYGHVDLLTVVTHELGHVLGFASIDADVLGHDWMTATLGTGVRRSPDMAAGSALRTPSTVTATPAAVESVTIPVAPVVASTVSLAVLDAHDPPVGIVRQAPTAAFGVSIVLESSSVVLPIGATMSTAAAPPMPSTPSARVIASLRPLDAIPVSDGNLVSDRLPDTSTVDAIFSDPLGWRDADC